MKTIYILIAIGIAVRANAQDITHTNRKVILNSSNTISLFQSNSTNGIWASGIITGDRWGVFEDATSSKERLTILSGGNVGIATISPNEKLQIGNAFTFHDGGNKVMMIGHATGGVDLDPSKYAAELRFNPVNGYLSLGTSPSITSAPSPQLNISKDGKIGMGTFNTGSHKLAVDGSIGAREIKVEVGTWSDFVFYTDYELPTLLEVERHIKEKGHLKDIPSAKEVEENGVNLGEMNAKLLQKIEELMLYTIQQQKEIEKLKKALH